ncbi:MAG TPA: trypsin-like peptidase domain-containing protein [Solirubrobacteraceae bacterium]|nr:trypsin-like peptidase domain-containing protein [Solirubrobacteraceae bacterium]
MKRATQTTYGLSVSSPTLDPPSRFDPPRGPGVVTPAVAFAALALAVIGAAIALALALATGALHTGATTVRSTTVTQYETQPIKTSAAASEGWAPIYARTDPGLVDVTVQATTTVDTPFGPEEEHETDLGSGMVLDGRGDILTAAHVVADAGSITVAFANGVSRGAKVLGVDDSADVAVLLVSPAGLDLHPVTLGNDRSLAVGDPVGVIGDPLGFDRSLSTGVVSALDRTIEAPDGFTIAHAIQTDAALNPGNSGGPVLNSHGEVIGISDQIATGTNQFGRSSSQTSTGVGFAVPVDLATAELTQLERGEHVKHAYIGVATSTSETSQPGALIQEVKSGTPAANAGLRKGDVIVAFDGTAITNSNDLIDALAAARVGAKVTIAVLRGSKRLTFTLTLTAQPEQAPSG